jgi:hypothetical protein
MFDSRLGVVNDHVTGQRLHHHFVSNLNPRCNLSAVRQSGCEFKRGFAFSRLPVAFLVVVTGSHNHDPAAGVLMQPLNY